MTSEDKKKLKHLLIVDDEESMRLTAKKIVENAGFEVRTAPTVEDAVKSLASHPADLILLDLLFPESQSGFDLLFHRNQDKFLKLVPVIVMSGLADKASVTKAISFGANDYITKPLDARTLVQKVRKNLRSAEFPSVKLSDSATIKVKVTIKGKLLKFSPSGLLLKAPVKVSPESFLEIKSPLLRELKCEECVFRTTRRPARAVQGGEFIMDIGMAGIPETASEQIRKKIGSWKR